MQADPEGGSGEPARGKEGDARRRMTMLGAGATDGDRGAAAQCRGGGAAGCQSHGVSHLLAGCSSSSPPSS